MSTASIEKNTQSVIIRGYRGEPRKLFATSARGGVVEAHGISPEMSMGFHIVDVFAFDEAMFRKLRAAFDRGERRELDQLWLEAIPYDAAFNG